jgi:hypothetical protein
MKKFYCPISAFVLTILLGSLSFNLNAQSKTVPEQLAQQQLDAYNARDVEAFLKPYADTVAIYSLPEHKLIAKGKEQMRTIYANMFKKQTNLHCDLRNRIVQDNVVIDHEHITGSRPEPFDAVAVYYIAGDKIAKVYFFR